jgi:hypothetical protein
MSDIKVRIYGEFQKKGFTDAEKATNRLGKSFDRLASRLGAALSVAALYKYSKAAVKAFSEDDKAAKQLTRTYQNLGMAFEGAIVNDFIDQLQRATGVSDTELRPALGTLTRATLDYGQAQKLLGIAMDVSAGTGLDLATVSNALAKAQMGQMTSLARLNIGIGKSEASTISFDNALARLNRRFSGQAALAASTYEGQINRLKVAADEAQESLGKDLVLAISRLTNGKNLSSLGDQFQKIADNAGEIAVGIADVIGQLNKNVSATGAGGWINKFNELMSNLNLFERVKTRGQEVITGTKVRSLGAPGAMAAAKENARILAAERAEMAKIVALEKARAKEQAKQKRLRQITAMLAQKESKFDLERIGLAAAAQGNLSDEERNRIAQLQTIQDLKAAIAADDLNQAEELLAKLTILQDKTSKLAESLITFPKANDPFIEWTTTLTGVQAQLLAIAQKKIVVDFLANFTPISSASITAITKPSSSSAAIAAATSPAASAAATSTDAAVAAAAGDAAAAKAAAEAAAADAAVAAAEAAAAAAAATTPEEKAAAEAAIKAAEEAAQAAIILDESAAALAVDAATAAADAAAAEAAQSEAISTLIDAEASLRAASDALAASSIEFDASVISATTAGATPITEVTVNVSGSVISEGDLVEMITDNIYRIQKTGKRITLSSIEI